MKKILVFAFLATSALMSTSAMAQSTNANREPACQTSGTGMDPRCVGVKEPGAADRGMRTRTRMRVHHARHHRHAVRSRHHMRRHARGSSTGVTAGSAACSRDAQRHDPRCLD
ncbi:MAG: hypothetical protein JWL62_2777 [Hyphomicrobiales bacterium]|nr:hypothetical protein [Hyphomicrobiales bacterium]